MDGRTTHGVNENRRRVTSNTMHSINYSMIPSCDWEYGIFLGFWLLAFAMLASGFRELLAV